MKKTFPVFPEIAEMPIYRDFFKGKYRESTVKTGIVFFLSSP